MRVDILDEFGAIFPAQGRSNSKTSIYSSTVCTAQSLISLKPRHIVIRLIRNYNGLMGKLREYEEQHAGDDCGGGVRTADLNHNGTSTNLDYETTQSDDRIPKNMHAWRVKDRPGPIEHNPLEYVEIPVPTPQPGEVLVRVLACGVCRTDLHVSEGDLPVHQPHVTPGHEIVGEVVAIAAKSNLIKTTPRFSDSSVAADQDSCVTSSFNNERLNYPQSDIKSDIKIGERVGIAWLRSTCGRCEYCVNGKENLCQHSQYTGWDANGGYAQYATAPVDYVYSLEPLLSERPESNEQDIAPLLCAGIIGYRALKRTGLLDGVDLFQSHNHLNVQSKISNDMKEQSVSMSARNRNQTDVQPQLKAATQRSLHVPVLGLYGFGGSAHITAQVALALGMRVHVLTRGESSRQLALSLGCASAAGAYDMPPEPLDAAIIFAPVGDIVPPALRALRSGGVLSLAGIHMSDIPALNYEHEVFHEKEIRSVESNTRQDGREFLEFARMHQLHLDTHTYPLSHGQQALQDLKAGKFAGAAVLVP